MNKYLNDRVGPGKNKTCYKEANSWLSLLKFKLDFPICKFSVASYLDTVRATRHWNSHIFPTLKPAQESQETATLANYPKIPIWTSASFRGEERFQILSKLTWKDNGTGLFLTTFPMGLPAEVKCCLFWHAITGSKGIRTPGNLLTFYGYKQPFRFYSWIKVYDKNCSKQ